MEFELKRRCHIRPTILSALGPYHTLTVLFLETHTRTSQWVTHRGSALACYSLNFGVPMNSKTSELPKGLVLGRGGNVHIRLTRFSPLGDVGCYNPHPLGARSLRRYTSGHGVAMIPNCHISTRGPPHPEPDFRRSTILSSLGPDHALVVFFFWELT